MSSSLHRTGMLLGLVLVLWGGLSWGQLPPTNDTSDGRLNTGGGSDALASTTTGAANTAYGAFALTSNTTGRANTAYGFNALLNTTTSADNIAIGALAGNQLISGNGNIYIGNPGGIASESGIIRLGANQTATYIAGIAGTGVRVGTPVFIANSGLLGTQPSAARYKQDIEPLGAHRQGLFQLRPVTFRYREDPQGARQYGLIAEEVATVYPELVIHGATGEIESVQYQALIPLLLHALQHQQAQMADQQRQVAELHAQNARIHTLAVQLQQRDEAQQAQNAALAARLEQLEAAAARATAVTSR